MSALVRFLETAHDDPTRRYVAVVTLSGPRDGGDRRRNANYGRLAAGRVIEHRLKLPHIVSGHRGESGLLHEELNTVSRELGFANSYPQYELMSKYTAGNASNVLQYLADKFKMDPIDPDLSFRPKAVVVCTHAWHAERVKWLFDNIQAFMGVTIESWIGKIPFEIVVVGVESDDLDPDFWVPYAEAEPHKLVLDKERTALLYDGKYAMAPTQLRLAVQASNTPNQGFNNPDSWDGPEAAPEFATSR